MDEWMADTWYIFITSSISVGDMVMSSSPMGQPSLTKARSTIYEKTAVLLEYIESQ